MTPTPPCRRWFRYVVLIVMALALTTVIAYHINWVQQRREFALTRCTIGPATKAPGLLPLLLEDGHSWIALYLSDSNNPHQLTEAEQERIKTTRALFPEAEVKWLTTAP
jgi:hypothetical protein